MNYSYTRKINMPFVEALDEVRLVFAENGFGVVSNINVAEKIRKKIDKNFLEYNVLGVCAPEIAYEFLSENMDLGVFMPCSVAVYEKTDGVYVSVGLPKQMIFDIIKNKNLENHLENLSKKFIEIIDSI